MLSNISLQAIPMATLFSPCPHRNCQPSDFRHVQASVREQSVHALNSGDPWSVNFHSKLSSLPGAITWWCVSTSRQASRDECKIEVSSAHHTASLASSVNPPPPSHVFEVSDRLKAPGQTQSLCYSLDECFPKVYMLKTCFLGCY
jgi:hypothetical protein